MKRLLLLGTLLAGMGLSADAQLTFCIIDGKVRSGSACGGDDGGAGDATGGAGDAGAGDSGGTDPVDTSADDEMLGDDDVMGDDMMGEENAWETMPGRLSQIDAGADGTLYGLGTVARNGVYEVYRYNGSAWSRVPGRVNEVEVGPDGLAIGSGTGERFWQNDGSRWTRVRGETLDVAVDDRGTRFAALSDGNIVELRDDTWVTIAQGDSVEAGPGGLVVTQSAGGPLSVHSPFGRFVLPGDVSDYSVGADGRIYAVLVDGAAGVNEAVTWDVPFGWRSLGMTDVAGVTAGVDGRVYAWSTDGTVSTKAHSN